MSGIIDASRGYLTETSTGFGRHYPVFQALEERLKKSKPSSMKCLIIGPGLESDIDPIPRRFVKTYQAYELANSLLRAGVNDYEVECVDINPDILEEMRKVPTLLRIRRDFWEHIHHYRESDEQEAHSKKYFENFFAEFVIESDTDYRVVDIPKSVTDRINLRVGDVIIDDIPQEQYDIVVCTVLLSHYTRDMTHDKFDPVPGVLEKLSNSIKPNGYFIDSQSGFLNGFELLEFCAGSSATHNTSASLLQKN